MSGQQFGITRFMNAHQVNAGGWGGGGRGKIKIKLTMLKR